MHKKMFPGNVEGLRSPERVKRLEVHRVIELCLEGTSIRNVLDVGTGSGLFAEAFSGEGLKVSGVDVNPKMLASAKSFVPTGEFREGIAEALPYQDKSFDLVFLGLVLHESEDVLKALKEALRVSRKRVCILEWPYKWQLFGPPLGHRLKPERLEEMFRAAGFQKWQTTILSNTVLYRLNV